MKWFRWYRGTVSNPKLALVAAKATRPSDRGENDRVRGAVSLTDVIAVWAVILEDAAKKEHWGTCTRSAEYIAMVIRWFPEEVQNVLDAMVDEGMIGGGQSGLNVLNWNEYQYASDRDPTNPDRQRKWYDKNKRKPNARVTDDKRMPNGNLTRTDSESDKESLLPSSVTPSEQLQPSQELLEYERKKRPTPGSLASALPAGALAHPAHCHVDWDRHPGYGAEDDPPEVAIQ